jgi:hypothetical protein
MSNTEPSFSSSPELQQQFLINQALQNTTLAWRQALRFETALGGGFLQGYLIEASEPTTAFRMDSKAEFPTPVGPRRHKLYIHTPQDSNPSEFLNRTWVKHVRPEGIEAMYSLSQKEGVQVLDPTPLSEVVEEYEQADQDEVEGELIEAALAQMRPENERERIIRINNSLRIYNNALLNGLVVVKFYS